MDIDSRLECLDDARYHIRELSNILKRLGCKYMNAVDILDDIRSSVDIDIAIAEEKQRKQWEREQRAMRREYYQTT